MKHGSCVKRDLSYHLIAFIEGFVCRVCDIVSFLIFDNSGYHLNKLS